MSPSSVRPIGASLADLALIKATLKAFLGEDFGASHRVETFARLCGLCCLVLMVQAPALDGQFLDLLPFCQDNRAAPEVDISRREVAEALVIAVVVVMLDKVSDVGAHGTD